LETNADGTPARWATMNLMDSPMLRGQALPRTAGGYWSPQRGPQSRADSPFRKIQERQLARRANHPQAGTKWAQQREDMTSMMTRLRAENLVGQTMQAVQMQIDTAFTAASAYRAGDRSTSVASHDYSTGYIYIHSGSPIGAENGVLVTADEISEHTALGDVV